MEKIPNGFAQQRLAPLVIGVNLDVSLGDPAPDHRIVRAQIEDQRSGAHHLQ
jgi:hypothetical protein